MPPPSILIQALCLFGILLPCLAQQSASTSNVTFSNTTTVTNSSGGQIITTITNVTYINSTSTSSSSNQTFSSSQNSSYGNQTFSSSQNSSYGNQTFNASQNSSYGNETFIYSQNSSYGNQTFSSSQNSSYETQWNYTRWSTLFSYEKDVTWSYTQWYKLIQSVNIAEMSWNYTAWYSYMMLSMKEGFTCKENSIGQATTASILTLFDALSKHVNNRTDTCLSLKASFLLNKNILQKCKEEESQLDTWESSSRSSVLYYSRFMHIDEFVAIYRCVCTATTTDSILRIDYDEVQTRSATCEPNLIRNSILAFFKLGFHWEDIRVCKEITQAVEETSQRLSACEWELSSSLSLLVSVMKDMKSIMCTPPSCNVEYASLCLANAELLWHAHEQNMTQNMTIAITNITTTSLNNTAMANSRISICRNLKLGIACVTNHTIDCQQSIYLSISSRFEQVNTIYKQMCPDFIPAPRTCPTQPENVIQGKSNISSIAKIMKSSFLFNNSDVCRSVLANNGSQDLLDTFCYGSACSCNLPLARSLILKNISSCSFDKLNIVTSIRGCSAMDIQALLNESSINQALLNCAEVKYMILSTPQCSSYCPTFEQLKQQCNQTNSNYCISQAMDCFSYAAVSCSNAERSNLLYGVISLVSNSCQNKTLTKDILNGSLVPVFNITSDMLIVNECIEKIKEPSSTLLQETITYGLGCLNEVEIKDVNQLKVESFLNYLESNLLSDMHICAADVTFKELIFNITKSILQGTVDVGSCRKTQSVIDNWFTSCGYGDSSKQNLTAIFSLVCHQEIQLTNCSYNEAYSCFYNPNVNLTGEQYFQTLQKCINASVATCKGPLPVEYINLAKNITLAFGYKLSALNQSSSVSNFTGSCGCDPAAAINCIMDVHHMAKQPSPDWESLCPLLPLSKDCAYSYVSECDECKRSTVVSIVSKLNNRLEEQCIEPPETVCPESRAMKCVTDLANFQTSSKVSDNNSICVKITLARDCVYEETKNCDDITSLSISKRLEQVIKQWTNLKCNDTEDQLVSCLDIFQKKVYSIVGFDVSLMEINVQNSSIWTQVSSLCEELQVSWSCVKASLNLQNNNTSGKIIKKSMQALYTAVDQICTARRDTLQCYSCQGEGAKTCADGAEVETCNNNQICETVTEAGLPKSRGCKPEPACKPGCFKDKCTYCCSNNLCNDLNNGPLAGYCNTTSLASCVLDLSAEYIQKKEIQCSSASVVLDCIHSKKADCELGGRKDFVDTLSSLNISAEVKVCLIQEANQTCDIGPISTTAVLINTNGLEMSEDDLCNAVNESRGRVAQAESFCLKDSILEFKQTQWALEAMIGSLNCSEKYNFTIQDNCRPLDALKCFTSVLNSENIPLVQDISCNLFNETTQCVKEAIKNCTSACQLVQVNSKFEVFKSIFSQVCSTDVKIIEKNVTDLEIATCISNFTESVGKQQSNHSTFSFETITDAFNNLRSCFMGIEVDIFGETSTTKYVIEIILNLVEIVSDTEMTFPMNVTPKCEQSINTLMYGHVERIFTLPFLSLSQREHACGDFDDEQAQLAVRTNCTSNMTSSYYEVLDTMREKFIINFCPEIKPVPRCLISRAEECMDRFTAYLNPNSSDGLCREARETITCAVDYSQFCSYDEIKEFHRKAIIISDIVSQTCYDDTELITKVRCQLLGRIDVQPGCSELTCNKDFSDCSEAEEQAACLIKSAGLCTNPNLDTTIIQQVSKIGECRYGEPNSTISLTSCSQLPFKCDIDEAKKCLTSALTASTVNYATVKQCFEENFYCLGSTLSLVDFDLSIVQLFKIIIDVTPGWEKLESEELRQILSIPTHIIDLFNKSLSVSLNLWDVCQRLDTIALYIQDIQRKFTNSFFPAASQSVTKILNVLNDFCDSGDVDQNLEFPVIESSSCPFLQVNAELNLLVSRSISEFYSPSQLANISLCRLHSRLQEKLDFELSGSCSASYTAQSKFILKIAQTILGDRCQVDLSEEDVQKRCDLKMVEQCIHTLNKNIQDLGKSQTITGLCLVLEKTDYCVERFSYKCDRCALSRINAMYKSVKESAAEKCTVAEPEPVSCQENDPEDTSAKCDVKKAAKCAFNQMKETFKIFKKNKDKCKKLSENLDCVQKYTANCNSWIIPKLALLDSKIVGGLQRKYGCEVEQKDEVNFGCRPGCWVNEANKCFDLFYKHVPKSQVVNVKRDTCQYINTLRSCISYNTTNCNKEESKQISLKLSTVLDRLPGHEDLCIDLPKCAQDFDRLVRLLNDLKPELNVSDSGTVQSEDLNNESDNDDEDTSPASEESQEPDTEDDSPFNLNTVCVQAKAAWGCLQKGIKNLPKGKKKVLTSIYGRLWDFVTDKCDDTREFSCYSCKNVMSSEECTADIETCPMNKRACMFKQILTGKGIKYSAGCIPISACKSKVAGNERTSCCTSDRCNTISQSSTPAVQEPVQCRQDYALGCALDFVSEYLSSETIKCNQVSAYLGCIQKYSSSCSRGSKLAATSVEIHLYFANTECVLDAPADCYSLAITSLQSVLSNSYFIQGNSPCLSMNETANSVTKILASEKCTEAGKISLQQSFDFLHSVVQPYCSQGQCSDSSADDDSNDDASCSGIFSGIKHIYKGYDQLVKGSEKMNCGECATSALKARKALKNCDIAKFVSNKLDELDTGIQKNCHIKSQIELPQVCKTLCQEEKIITFVDNIARNISSSTKRDLQCWYLAQVAEAYQAYTSGCSSIQQRDVVNYINYVFEEYISDCEHNYVEFQFELVLNVDIYISIAKSQLDFQQAIQIAFQENSQEKTCAAISNLRNSNWNVPVMIMDFLVGPAKQIIEALDAAKICSNIERTKRDSPVCQLDKLASLIYHISSPPHIASAPVECRNKYCQQMESVFDQADSLVQECGDALSLFQKTLFKIFQENYNSVKNLLCPALRYEEEQCDLNLTLACRKDFESVSQFAMIDSDVLCRLGKFTLECTARFTKNCSSVSDIQKAEKIQLETKILVKQAVGNNCSLLTPYFYCNESLSVLEPACREEEAKKCMALSDFDFTKTDNVSCQYLQNNVSCVQKAMSGCQANQIKTLGWSSKVVAGVCNIADATLNNVCVSTPLCPSKSIAECFSTSPNNCSSLQKAVTCVNTLLAANKQCSESWGTFIVRNYVSVYYERLYQKCNLNSDVTVPQFYNSSCLVTLVKDVNVALVTKYRTKDQMFSYFVSRFINCLQSKENISPIITMLLDLNVQLNHTVIYDVSLTYNSTTDQQFIDTDTCYYSQARACLTKQILRVTTVKLLNGDERNELCDSYSQSTVSLCIEQALSKCGADKSVFLGVNTLVDVWIENLEICDPPKLCIVSEASELVNKLAAAMASFDRTNDKDSLCEARLRYKERLDSYLFTCAEAETVSSKQDFMVLYTKVESICKDIETPSLICPQIPERNRVCYFGNAFRCIARWNSNTILTGDSLIWRQQCLAIQSVMVCVATNTTSCDSESSDVKAIRESLDEFRQAADTQCPWLSDDLCTKQEICSVVTAGCEVELENGLINRAKTVCELKKEADDCVAKNTVNCNRAQKHQAVTVIAKKLQAAGFPTDLSCDNNSYDGCLYSFMSVGNDIYIEKQKNESCQILYSQYQCISTRFSNPNNSALVALGRQLLSEVYRLLNASYCTEPNTLSCTKKLPMQKLSVLITQLLFTEDLHSTSFCAKSLDIIQELKLTNCYTGLYEIIQNSTAFQQRCVSESVSCSDAEAKIQECIKGFSSSSCFDNQAALCITKNLPANCTFKSEWISQSLCNDTVVLVNAGQQNSKNFISESGLYTTFKWKWVAGSRNFKVLMTAQAVNSSALPRCLEGSQTDEPIPQIYTERNPKVLANESNEIIFNIYARQDYIKDGPVSIDTIFKLIPCRVENGTLQEIKTASFKLATFRVEVDDRDVKISLCTVINDPHVKTFDNFKYNNMEEGKYIIYRHPLFPVAVIAEFRRCAKYGSCTCGMEIKVGLSTLTLSKCRFAPFITYDTPPGMSTDKQRLRLFQNKDQNTYVMVLLDTGAMVKITNQDTFMNVIIMGSRNYFGYSQGQCGDGDGNGYNDLRMPNSSLYKVMDTDYQFNVMSPTLYNQAWFISNSSNLSSVYGPDVDMSYTKEHYYCYGWENNLCSTYGHIETCSFIQGEDQTSQVLEMQSQVQSSGGSKRRKRQAEAEIPKETTAINSTQTAGWPTSTGWTLENATLYCLDNLFNKPLQACKDAISAIDATLKSMSFDDPVAICVDDIRVSGGTEWVEAARQAASQLCIIELNHNPEYQNQKQSNDLALTFLNLTCLPYDCNNHGTCNKGQCICNTGYFGVDCNMTMDQLVPPVLEVFEDNLHICEISDSTDCSAVYLTGSGFISSALLSCHVKESVEGATLTSVVSANLLSKDLVRCNLGTKSAIKRLLQISVSNDGRRPDPHYQNFLAFDPMCYSCNKLTCKKNTNVCFIGTKCIGEGEQSVYNECEYCDLSNPNKWSIFKDVAGCKEETVSKKDNETSVVATALIAAGVTLVVLLIILVGALFIYVKRRMAARKRESAAMHRYHNQAYQENPPFYGQPILAHNTKADIAGLLRPNATNSA
uniref:VWFD domain-containing protein n=1 Tax=Biomphalaria glabrata TaxID=6526 RepID=A0A2C9LI81_BIOGL